MMRLIDLAWASVVVVIFVVVASCSARPTDHSGGDPATPPPLPPPTTVLEQVQRSAPAASRVAAADLTVTGIELFTITPSPPISDDAYPGGTLVGVAGGLGGKRLEDRDLLRAVIDARPDAHTLARVALRVAQREGEILDAPLSEAQRVAKVRPPRLTRDSLDFWVWTTEVPRLTEHGKLDLATGLLELEPPPMSPAATLQYALDSLAGPSASVHVRAIRILAEACADPIAQAGLLGALANHPRVKSRAAVADALHKCGAVAVTPLISAMERDRSGLVRAQAATALGRLADARARPPLAKAAKGEDPNLSFAARNALKKLP
jgi:HEAT repeats